jgi:hypothetical protein
MFGIRVKNNFLVHSFCWKCFIEVKISLKHDRYCNERKILATQIDKKTLSIDSTSNYQRENWLKLVKFVD